MDSISIRAFSRCSYCHISNHNVAAIGKGHVCLLTVHNTDVSNIQVFAPVKCDRLQHDGPGNQSYQFIGSKSNENLEVFKTDPMI